MMNNIILFCNKLYIVQISLSKLKADKKDGNEIIFDVLNINNLNIKYVFMQGHLNKKKMQWQK